MIWYHGVISIEGKNWSLTILRKDWSNTKSGLGIDPCGTHSATQRKLQYLLPLCVSSVSASHEDHGVNNYFPDWKASLSFGFKQDAHSHTSTPSRAWQLPTDHSDLICMEVNAEPAQLFVREPKNTFLWTCFSEAQHEHMLFSKIKT